MEYGTFSTLASRNPRRPERKYIPHFPLSQISSPYNLAIGKLIIIEKNKTKKNILWSNPLEETTSDIGTPRNEIDASEELTLFERNEITWKKIVNCCWSGNVMFVL